ncbi:MAG TPA: acetolactate decarboxylase [Ideonella sp.]|uniref:acetolactate decarboxylase n=1 Tax=Ideonella sp. TaxID=1929293 RepID=UPI002E3181C5|nr:acetolactate decarboxylase [Ideonella sp.]HEX5687106.1 acetolactate decarboxylase [Ideonella sp.]
MSHTGDTGGQVKLADLPQATGGWGVGALAGLKGEVLLRDGRLLVSRGDDPQGRVAAPLAGDEAVLFAAARVRQWAEVTLPAGMTRPQFEAFVLAQAKALGLDVGEPFPFLVQGHYPQLVWHVVTGQPAKPGIGGHAGAASKRVFEQPGADGQLVGMYSGEQLEGVVSHPGERFHVHYADDAASVSGHVDAYAVARGGVLKLPLQ